MILVKTDVGQQALKDRSVPLTPRQRSAFILFDGKRSVDDVIAAGMGITAEDIDQMVDAGRAVVGLSASPNSQCPTLPDLRQPRMPRQVRGAASSSATRTPTRSPPSSPAAWA
jgi:hypothetical protein